MCGGCLCRIPQSESLAMASPTLGLRAATERVRNDSVANNSGTSGYGGSPFLSVRTVPEKIRNLSDRLSSRFNSDANSSSGVN